MVSAVIVGACAILLCSCGQTLKSCAAHILIVGPAVFTLECPPPGFRQEGDTTSELPVR